MTKKENELFEKLFELSKQSFEIEIVKNKVSNFFHYYDNYSNMKTIFDIKLFDIQEQIEKLMKEVKGVDLCKRKITFKKPPVSKQLGLTTKKEKGNKNDR